MLLYLDINIRGVEHVGNACLKPFLAYDAQIILEENPENVPGINSSPFDFFPQRGVQSPLQTGQPDMHGEVDRLGSLQSPQSGLHRQSGRVGRQKPLPRQVLRLLRHQGLRSIRHPHLA